MKYSDREMARNNAIYTPRKFLIVDGYNVINAWDGLKELTVKDLEIARDTLIGYIQEYSKIKGYEAYIVFDAYKVKGQSENIENHHGVTVVYTKENQTADSYIEKFISSISKYDEVAVVTSDYAEQQIVLGKGCSRIPARELIEDLNRQKNNLRKKNKDMKQKYNTMNRLENKIDSNVLDKLEEIRRRK